jgi:quercetin dioxygenase-like cupin family protein
MESTPFPALNRGRKGLPCTMENVLTLLIATLLQTPAAESTQLIKLQAIVENQTLQAVRMEYLPGAVEPPDAHDYDVVLVPLTAGMSMTIEGKPAAWTPGVPILLPRGAPHSVWNPSSASVTFISVRQMGGALPSGAAVDSTGVTLVRSTEGEHLHATTFRFARGSQLYGIGTRQSGPTLFVLVDDAAIRMTVASTISESGPKRAGAVWLFEPGMAYGLANLGSDAFEIVAISPTGR